MVRKYHMSMVRKPIYLWLGNHICPNLTYLWLGNHLCLLLGNTIDNGTSFWKQNVFLEKEYWQ